MKRKKEKLFLKYFYNFYEKIFRYCFVSIKNNQIAQDLVQETFIRFWQILKEQEVDFAKTLLYKIAKNLIIDYSRKKENKLFFIEEIKNDFIDSDLIKRIEDKVDLQRILNLLDQIEEKYKEILLLRFVEELSIKEISEITGVSQNNVSVIIHRGLKKLKDLFNQNER